MTPEQLSTVIVDALRRLAGSGAVSLPDGVPAHVVVERPKVRDHGDYATNVALQLAKRAGMPPRELAGLLAEELLGADGVAEVDVAGPGFLNLRVAAGAQGTVAGQVVALGSAYGSSDLFAGEHINLEFVSANPTGPIHIGGVRWAAVGDALGRVFSFTGAEVTREYYFNDHGAQIDRFARSLLASAQGRPAPEDGYAGQYLVEIARAVTDAHPGVLELPEEEAQETFRAEGVEMMFAEIKKALHEFGVDFDVYFHENHLHETGAVQRAVDRLTELGNTYEADGALWLRTEQFGDAKDRVILRSNGQPAYLSGDLAYYLDKRERGFDRCLIMLGADHHGYVDRLMAMCAAFGDRPGENLEILIGQMVNLLSDGVPVRMSKRAGTGVTIDDIVGAIGIDAARYALARYSSDSEIDIDLDLWARATSDNPVYYVQYAHARTSSILRNAEDLGLGVGGFETGAERLPQPPGGTGAERLPQPPDFDPSLLSHEKEGELLRALAEFPGVVGAAAQLREPHRVARYLEQVAASYHRFYDNCRVLPMGDEEPGDLHRARLVLVAATRQVIANGLGLLGVSAPERM